VVRLPEVERVTVLPDGREQRFARWTVWTALTRYADADAYSMAKRREIGAWTGSWDAGRRARMSAWLESFSLFLADLPGLIDELIELSTLDTLLWIDHLPADYGIEASQLLPLGTPGEIGDAVRRALDDAGGRLLVGSSTEVDNAVPLVNFLAMREAVIEFR
jgi:hypothetical protein